ncbi:MAG: hypothetical protein WCV58_03945 [Patescibacteria group bacterium]
MSSSTKWFLVILLILSLAGLLFIGRRFFYNPNPSPIISPLSSSILISPSPSPTTSSDDWLTYINNDIGYSLKYPKDWTVVEVDETSQLDGKKVKYVNLYSADKKYGLAFGIKKVGDDSFRPFERSGIGNGDMIPVTSKPTTILETNFIPDALTSEDKIKEFFYRSSTNKEAESQCQCSFESYYGLVDSSDYNSINLSINLLDTSNKILQSVQWL